MSGWGGGLSHAAIVQSGQLNKISVMQLKEGMHVVRLDRPWEETPLTETGGFVITSQAQIQQLSRYCNFVLVGSAAVSRVRAAQLSLVDDAGGGVRGSSRSAVNNISARLRESRHSLFRTNPAYQNTTSAQEEHPRARALYAQGLEQVEAALSSAREHHVVDASEPRELIGEFADSIIRNPDALLWMTRIKHELAYTAEHGVNVSVLAMAFGRHLHFDRDELATIGLCGLLHDVGKVLVPDEVLNKPGPLTVDELDLVRRHTVDGHQLLSETDVGTCLLSRVARDHHERPDGEGYPRGLRGRQIHEYARIVALVDAYDAITSHRCYAPGVAPVEAQKVIYAQRGKQFDEDYALAFMQAMGPYPPGTLVELHNGLVGIVLAGRARFRHLPKVMVVRNADKTPVRSRLIDLYLTDSGELGKEFLIRRGLPDGSHGVAVEKYRIGAPQETNAS